MSQPRLVLKGIRFSVEVLHDDTGIVRDTIGQPKAITSRDTARIERAVRAVVDELAADAQPAVWPAE